MSGKSGANLGMVGRSGLRVAGSTLVGALCGVGALWTLTILWPVSKGVVYGAGRQLEQLSGDHPVVMMGLLVGAGVALAVQALRNK